MPSPPSVCLPSSNNGFLNTIEMRAILIKLNDMWVPYTGPSWTCNTALTLHVHIKTNSYILDMLDLRGLSWNRMKLSLWSEI